MCFEELNDFPGPLIKWFYKVLEPNKIFDIVKSNPKAKAKVIIGYFDGVNSHFFQGVISGNIVSPRGNNGFNWDVIFQPLGYLKTFAEMDNYEKNFVSMRRLATLEFKKFLEQNLK